MVHTVTESDFEERGDLYYTGPLEEAKAFIQWDTWTNERKIEEPPCWEVTIAYGSEEQAPDECADWGRGPDLETAWRYALGAAFGPLDSEFHPLELTHDTKEDG